MTKITFIEANGTNYATEAENGRDDGDDKARDRRSPSVAKGVPDFCGQRPRYAQPGHDERNARAVCPETAHALPRARHIRTGQIKETNSRRGRGADLLADLSGQRSRSFFSGGLRCAPGGRKPAG